MNESVKSHNWTSYPSPGGGLNLRYCADCGRIHLSKIGESYFSFTIKELRKCKAQDRKG